ASRAEEAFVVVLAPRAHIETLVAVQHGGTFCTRITETAQLHQTLSSAAFNFRLQLRLRHECPLGTTGTERRKPEPSVGFVARERSGGSTARALSCRLARDGKSADSLKPARGHERRGASECSRRHLVVRTRKRSVGFEHAQTHAGAGAVVLATIGVRAAEPVDEQAAWMAAAVAVAAMDRKWV